MKLFVWERPYTVFYGSSMLIAVAESVEEAKRIAKSAPGYSYTIFDGHPNRSVKLGEPTRVVDLPCAEWHEWSE